MIFFTLSCLSLVDDPFPMSDPPFGPFPIIYRNLNRDPWLGEWSLRTTPARPSNAAAGSFSLFEGRSGKPPRRSCETHDTRRSDADSSAAPRERAQ
jgi:hypothetical protein